MLVPETLLPVRADPALLERAVANVVANALAYTPDGERVRVEASELGRRVQLRVIDRGPGIPEQDRQRVFQPFQRLGDSAPGGVGLGLAVAHGFLAAMGATIEIDDTPGGGSDRDDQPAGGGMTPAASSSSTTSNRSCGRWPSTCAPVATTSTSRRPVRRRWSSPPATIPTSSSSTSDLPGIGGLDVIRGLRGWTAVPIVILSARDDRANKVAALDAGADDYVTKPFDMEELLARLRAALRRGSSGVGGGADRSDRRLHGRLRGQAGDVRRRARSA